MIRRDEKGGCLIITQDHHSALACEVMEHWGGGAFEAPRPRDEFLFAVKTHDSGWREWEAEPKIDPGTGHPANFMEMSTKDQYEIWTRCYKEPYHDHPSAAVLIALHFAKFNQRTLDKEPGDEYAVLFKRDINQFIRENLGIELNGYSLDDVPMEIKVNLELLQIGDIISLTLCHGWKSIEIKDAPLDYEGNTKTLRLKSQGGIKYTVDPYPFNEPLLNFSILSRRLVGCSFSDDLEYREALEKAEWEKLYFELSQED